MEKHMCGQAKENEEDTLIAILKSLVGECKVVYTNKGAQIETSSHGTDKVQGVSFVADDKEGDISGALPCQLPPKELNLGSFTLPCTIGSLNLYAIADLGASVNVMPKSIFEHLKLANLKEIDMVVQMANITKKAPIGIVENIMVKINKFLFLSDFVIIDMLGESSETMIMGRQCLATIHAQIDVFKREISLGIGEDKEKFDMDGGVCHSRIPVEKIYMANSTQEEEYFNPLEIKDSVFSYESPSCLLFDQCTQSCDNESVNTLDSTNIMQELEDKHEDMVRVPNIERIMSRWHVCKPVWAFYDNECGKDYEMWPTCNPDLSFCSAYDAIYGKGTDVATTTRKRPKLDKHRHENGKECTRAGDLIAEVSSKWLDLLLTKLEFPQELSKVHNMFHVSNLKKSYADEPLAVPLDGLHMDDKLHFVEEPVEIVGREVKRLKRSRIPLVKVRWNSKRGPEFTWEREDQFKKKYPHLFTKTTPSSSAAS
ncbi:phospholipase-like protein [Tanacetum coccineum]